jgi:hypothetical protein
LGLSFVIDAAAIAILAMTRERLTKPKILTREIKTW